MSVAAEGTTRSSFSSPRHPGGCAGSEAETRDVTPKLPSAGISLRIAQKHERGSEAALPADMDAGSPAEELCVLSFWSNLPFIQVSEREVKLFPQLGGA